MKKILLGLSLLLSSLSFSAEKLYVGTNGEYPPYEYLENGKLTGFDVELMELIGKKAGFEIVWKNIAFDGLIPALQTNKLDAVISGMKPTETRKKAVDFSKPYIIFENGNLVIVNEKSSFAKKEDLKGKIVAAQLGSIQEEMAKNLGATTRAYTSYASGLMDLQNNKIDGFIIAEKVGSGFLKEMKGLKAIDNIVDDNPGVAIAFQKNKQKLVDKVNKALVEIQNSPEYEALAEKYFPGEKYKK